MSRIATLSLTLLLPLAACGDKTEVEVGTEEICGDGLDNDGNGVADCEDSYCASLDECSGGDSGSGGGSGSGGDDGTEDWPDIVVNEFMASNATTIQDEAGAYPDWIELYNPTDEDVDLGGWFMTDNLEDPEKSELPDVTIEAGGFLLLFADDDQEDGPLHLNFSLDAQGEAIGLYGPDGGTVEELEFDEQAVDISMARIPDGSGTWQATGDATPGESNGS